MTTTVATLLPDPGTAARRVLVTGASGFIGSRVVSRLAAAGWKVRGFVRSTSRTDRLEGVDWEPAPGDLLDPESLRRAATGCDAVVHAAGLSAWSDLDSPRLWPVIVEGTKHVLDAARRQSVPRVVFVSTAATLGPSRSAAPRDETAFADERAAARMPYVQAKREAERLCLESAKEREIVIVNPAEAYGPGDRDLITAGNLLGLLSTSRACVCPGGTCIVHVDDAAEGIVRALERGRSGERYLLGGDNLHHHQLARLLYQLAGRVPRVVELPRFVFRGAAATARLFRLPFPLPPAVIPYVDSYWFLDTRKACRELEMCFRTAQETLSETVGWLREAGYQRGRFPGAIARFASIPDGLTRRML